MDDFDPALVFKREAHTSETRNLSHFPLKPCVVFFTLVHRLFPEGVDYRYARYPLLPHIAASNHRLAEETDRYRFPSAELITNYAVKYNKI